jgi:hypothetical protein
MYAQLQESGELDEYLKGVEKEVKELMAGMVEKGSSFDQAWEMAKDLVYLPTEEDVPVLGEGPVSL